MDSESLKTVINEFNKQELGIVNVQKRKPNKNPAPGVKTRVDWEEVMKEYVIGYVISDPETGRKIHKYPTLDELADKYGVSANTVKGRSSKENWTLRREAFQAKIREKNSVNTFHAFVSESAAFDARTLIILDKLYGLAEAYFEQFDFLEIGHDGNFHSAGYDPDNETTPQIKVTDLKGMVDLLDKAQALVRRTVGEPIFNAQQTQKSVAEEIFGENKGNGSANKVEDLIKKREAYQTNIDKLRAEMDEIKDQLNESAN